MPGKIIIDINKGSVNALFNNQDVTILPQKKQQVDFHLFSPYERVRMKINGYSSQAFEGSINGALKYEAAAANDEGGVKGTCTIDPAAGTAVYANVTQAGQLKYQYFTNNVEGPQENGFVRTSYIITPEDAGVYFLAKTRLNKLSFQFLKEASGTIYKKPVSEKVLPLNLSDVELKIGTSYTISQTIYYSADYLFDDGTVGTLVPNLKVGRTPKALVVDRNRKVCMSLTEIRDKKWARFVGWKCISSENQDYNGLKNTIDKYDGYAQTWDFKTTDTSAGVLNWKRQKSNREEFEAFWAAGQLTPVGSQKWYVPGAGEWDTALKYLGVADPKQGFVYGGTAVQPWAGSLGYRLQEILFYQADGVPLTEWYWAANDWKTNGQKKGVTVTAGSAGALFGAATKTQPTKVRPFINY